MSLETATAQLKEERERRILEAMMEDFYKRWLPEERCDQARFGTELHMLVRQIYREAQEPAFKQLEVLMRSMPLSIGLHGS
jgi:uncharacterized protein (DUF2267 family)